MGSIFNLVRKKSQYYTWSRDTCELPIYSIGWPGSKFYIVNSTPLLPKIQREYKTLAFPPVAADGAKNVGATSEAANKILLVIVNSERGGFGYSMTLTKEMYCALSPGFSLDVLGRIMAQKASASLDDLEQTKTVQLLEIVKHEIGMASTDSVYEPDIPSNDPAVELRF